MPREEEKTCKMVDNKRRRRLWVRLMWAWISTTYGSIQYGIGSYIRGFYGLTSIREYNSVITLTYYRLAAISVSGITCFYELRRILDLKGM